MSYEYEQFIKTIQHKAEVSWEKAESAAQAVLATLSERISAGEARDIARQLPEEVRGWIVPADGAEPFDADELIRRVAQREDVDLETAERHAHAVFTALGRNVGTDELEDLAAELPKGFEPLLAEARRGRALAEGLPEVLPVEEFLQRVADRAAIDEDRARTATQAVLETLGERIAGGEVEDLARELPPELGQTLLRGNGPTDGKAVRMSLDEFLARVAAREGITPSEAREHAAAVFATLREATSDREFRDMAAELPDEYRALLPALAAPR